MIYEPLSDFRQDDLILELCDQVKKLDAERVYGGAIFVAQYLVIWDRLPNVAAHTGHTMKVGARRWH